MTLDFEELDYHATPLGELSLRRRSDPRLEGSEIYEVKLGEDYLMSSLFTAGEVALADRSLAGLRDREPEVVVAGLGLGYTADAVLRHGSVSSLLVVEYLQGVIDWHRKGLVPLADNVANDPRCRLVRGDFFELVADPQRGFDDSTPGRRFDALLVDIDHSPRHWLAAANEEFYSPAGLRRAAAHLRPGGVFGLWSNDMPDEEFEEILESVFADRQTHVVTFCNPYTGGESASTVYVARLAG